LKRTAVLGLIFVVALQPTLMALLVADVQSTPTSWNISVVDSTGDVGWYASVALDSSNRPHISYQDYTNGNLKYAKWTGTTWSIETVDASTAEVGLSVSLALDSSDRPHMSYFDITNYDLRYAKWTGTAWSIQIVDSAGSVGWFPSLALDSSNNPHISYSAGLPADGDLKYAKWTGSAWSIQIVDSTGDVGLDTSLALDSSNRPHISYYDRSNGNLKYAKWTGTAWSIQTVDSAGNVGYCTSLALDSSNNPHISYMDWDPNYDLKYAKWTGTTWTTQTLDTAGYAGYQSDRSLALDSGGNPHIGYYVFPPYYDLKYAKWTGTTWSIETVDSSGDVGRTPSLALDSFNRPHISYYDYTNQDLKYATESVSDFSVSVSPASQTVVAGGSTIHTVTATLLAGTPGTVSLSLNLPPSVGVYTFTPQSGTPTFTSKLTITTLNTATPGTYYLIITATGMGLTKTASLTLTVTAQPKLTLDLNPKVVARGSSLTISGVLTPGQATSIRLYYRFPHATGTWTLATTMSTQTAGDYWVTVTVPTSLTPGGYDLVAVWFDSATGTYAASPIALLTIT